MKHFLLVLKATILTLVSWLFTEDIILGNNSFINQLRITDKAYHKNNLSYIYLIHSEESDINNTDTSSPSILNSLAGTWVHEKDSSSFIKIVDDKWIFLNGIESASPNDSFQIQIKNHLAGFVKDGIQGDFIILKNRSMELYYEILNLNESIISLFHFPSGRIHLYKKKKKGK